MPEQPLERDVTIPASVLPSLASAAQRAGEPASEAVRIAGRVAGDALAGRIAASVRLSDLDAADFWTAVNAETRRRGLGTFEWHRGVGSYAEVVVRDAADLAAPRDGVDPAERKAAAPFTEGLVEGMLAAVTGEAVAVLRVPEGGGEGARFIVGSPTLLRHVRLRMRGGESPYEALEAI